MSEWRHIGQMLIVVAIGVFLAIAIGLTLFWKGQNGLFEPGLAGSIPAKETAVFVRTQDRQTLSRIASVYGWDLPLPTKEEERYEAALLKTASGTVWRVSWEDQNAHIEGSLLKNRSFERAISPTSSEVLWIQISEVPLDEQGRTLVEGIALGAHHLAITSGEGQGTIALIGADVSRLHSTKLVSGGSGEVLRLSIGSPHVLGMAMLENIRRNDPSLADGLRGIIRHQEQVFGTSFAPLLAKEAFVSIEDRTSQTVLIRGTAQSEAMLVKTLAGIATARSQSIVRTIRFEHFERTDIVADSAPRPEHVREWSVYAFTGSTTPLFLALRGKQWIASSAKTPLLAAIEDMKGEEQQSALLSATMDIGFVTQEVSSRLRELSSSLRPLFILLGLPNDGRIALTLQKSGLGAEILWRVR